MIYYLISIILYLILLFLVKNTYVSSVNWPYKNSDYTEKLKLPLWLWLLSFIVFITPIINVIFLGATLIIYFISLLVDQWGMIKIENKFLKFLFKFLNKKF